MRVAVLYVPVIHEGYLRFFKKHAPTVDALYLIGPDLAEEHKFLEREIRALHPETTRSLIASLGLFQDVRALDASTAKTLNQPDVEVVTANEQISKRIAEAYFPKARLTYDDIFLRWDDTNVFAQRAPKGSRTSTDPFDISMINRCAELSHDSSCWWRHVGATVVNDKKIVLELHNTHVPSAHTPYANGDPRDNVEAGTHSDIATTMHAEQRLVAEAAKQGISLEGMSLYSTVFPCPVCAKLIAYSGIKTCYYASGHASLDGESIMNANGVELVFVQMPEGTRLS